MSEKELKDSIRELYGRMRRVEIMLAVVVALSFGEAVNTAIALLRGM